MMNTRTWASVLLAAALPIAVHAQVVAPCGPGRAFGILAWEAPSFTTRYYDDSTHAVFSFGGEVVVGQAAPNGRVRAGDVVVALNRNPITTRAGADLFAYPSGEVILTVRRGGTNIDIEHTFAQRACSEILPYRISGNLSVARTGYDSTVAAIVRKAGGGVSAGGRGGRGGGGGTGGGRGGVVQDSARLSGAVAALQDARLRIGAATTTDAGATAASVSLRNFGFGLLCDPACTRATARDGSTYWRFAAYPAVANLSVPGDGVAGRAGIRQGDVLISVNGHSPMTEEGALALSHAGRELTLTVEMSRGGRRTTYTLKL
jgi:hypothetical protein